ncbi:hypothetical protein PS2_030662 [Malus domestica]
MPDAFNDLAKVTRSHIPAANTLARIDVPRRGRPPVAINIMLSDDIEPRSVDECRRRTDWSNWKQAIQVELDSLVKRKVFGHVVPTPPRVKPVGYKWVFVRKRNEKNEIVRYKARLVAQGFSQRPGIDYEETYSPVMDVITFRYLISLVVSEKLNM